MTDIPYKPTETHKTLYRKIQGLLNSADGSYGKAAEILLPNLHKNGAKTIIWRFYKENIIPHNNEIRMMLGLPRYMYYQETEMGAPCTVCGVPHVYDCDIEKTVLVELETYNPDTHTIKRKRRKPAANQKPRNRRAVNLDSPASAAATIRNNASAEFVSALVEELSQFSTDVESSEDSERNNHA